MAAMTGIAMNSTQMRQVEAAPKTPKSAEVNRVGVAQRRLAKVGSSKKTLRGSEVTGILGVDRNLKVGLSVGLGCIGVLLFWGD